MTFRILLFFKDFVSLDRESGHMQVGWGQREAEKSQADSPLSAEPDPGLDPSSWDHDLSGNQESKASPAEPLGSEF